MAYTGLVGEFQAGLSGIKSDAPQLDLAATDLIEAKSVVVDLGSWRKMGGATTFGSAILGNPLMRATLDWWPTPLIQRLLSYASDGKVYKDDGLGDLDAVTLVSLLSTVAGGQWATGGVETAVAVRKAFLVNGVDQMHVLAGNGVTMAPITGPAADWTAGNRPRAVQPYGSALWAAAGHRIYRSLITNHEDFLAAGTLQFIVYPGVGEIISTLTTHQGSLYIGKFPFGIYVLDDADVDTGNWGISKISDAVGVADSPFAILPITNDALVFAPDGRILLLSAVQQAFSLGANVDNLSSQLGIMQFIKTKVNLNALDQIQTVWYAERQTAVITYPAAGSTLSTIQVWLDFSGVIRGEPAKLTWTDRDSCETIFLRKDANQILRPALGTATGTVLDLDKATRSKDGAGYAAEVQTPESDLEFVAEGLGARFKIVDFVELIVVPVAVGTVTVEVHADGVLADSKTIDVSGTGREKRVLVPVEARGKRLSVRVVSPATVAADMSIAAIRLYVRPSGHAG